MPSPTLNEPVPIELVGYQPGVGAVQRRLMSEFPGALEDVERRVRESGCAAGST